MKDHKGFDLIAQSFTGMLSITGEPESPPMRSLFSPIDQGSGHESLCPYQAFDTRNKPLILGVATDHFWVSFCEVGGVPHLAHGPRFASSASRVSNRVETITTVTALLRERKRDEWLALLEARGIPCAPVHTLGELDRHPHTHASEMILNYRNRDMKAVATALRINGKRPTLNSPPRIWESTRAILNELGYGNEEVEKLIVRGVVSAA